ncbi:MAG: hypothetical protein FJ026_11720, partial [Chloroflexi bacterium]|nr:hypothetical protein [Chloroflexota bacterium]
MAGTFDWVEIRTVDVPKTARFYEQVFGWKLLKKESVLGSEVWILDTGGEPRTANLRRLGFWQRPAGSSLGVFVYIWVEDIQAATQAIVRHGGQVLVPP